MRKEREKYYLLKSVQMFVDELRLLEENDTVLVGVSGGPDSVALLQLLLELKNIYTLTLVVARLEHGIRGLESKEQASFVSDLAEKLGLKSVVLYVDVPKRCHEMKSSLEEAARIVRYTFFKETAKKIGATKIALGHTANDQSETLLMRLIRGSGLEGLASMRPKRDFSPSVIRPLLNTYRKDILAYLKEKNIAYCTDSSNQEISCLRNKIRLKLIPLLEKEYNPNIVATLRRTASILSEKREWIASILKQESKKCFHYGSDNCLIMDLPYFSSQPLALQRELIRCAVQKVTLKHYKLDYTKVCLALDWVKKGKSKCFSLSDKLYLRKADDTLLIEQKRKKPLHESKVFCYKLHVPGHTWIPEVNIRIQATILDWSEIKGEFNPEKAYLDASSLHFPLYVRSRRAGDRFSPLGLEGTKKLKNFFIDAKITRGKREQIPLVVSDKTIVWVLGMRIAGPFKVTQKTKKVLLLEKMR